MDQIPLNIAQRLSYAPENFLLHDGVAAVVSFFEAQLELSGFKILFVYGSPRSGKTHLSIKLADLCARRGLYPRLIEGRELGARMSQEIAIESSHLFIIDDAQDYFSALVAGESGPFVSFIESARKAGAGVVIFSSRDLAEYSFDEHIRSRLLPGHGHALKPPSSEYLSSLVDLMARQRGIKLSERKINFLIRRLDRSIPEIEEYLERVNYLSNLFGKAIKLPLLSDAL